MNGKSKCKLLRDIRRKIAEENDIEYHTTECGFQGECNGTCPKCEAELKYLEREIAKRHSIGKRTAVAGIAAALMIGATGCEGLEPTIMQTDGDIEYIAPSEESEESLSTDGSECSLEHTETATAGEIEPETIEMDGGIAYRD